MKNFAFFLVAFLLGTALASGQALRDRTEAEDGVQVLTRGPVHEAFAETVTFDPEPGIVVAKAPPAAIEELPPDQKPEGANVAWIPGYWGWDDERSDFLWVSGVWRPLPPGRQWVPGYWGRSTQGVQWTSGYWANAKASEVEYLPEPPATVEVGPNIAASSADQTWLPGCWVWQQNRYAWRPGFWATAQPDWVWVPAHYVWAPRGHVFVDGYWDYSIGRRGVLFAPVYFNRGIYARPGFSYSPTTVIDLGVFTKHLFMRPQYQHYYFGDYYAANYRGVGFYPPFSINTGRFGYDPIYAHQRWQHRQDHQWEHQVQADFQHRLDHEEARPPRTWAAQRALVASQVNSTEKSFVVAASLAQLVKTKGSPIRFQPVAQEERQRLAKHGEEIQKFRQERQEREADAGVTSAANPSRQREPARVKFSTSPIVARSADQFGEDQAPPKRHVVLKPDLQVEPKPIQPQSQPQPKMERPAPQPQPQPEVEPPAPQPQPQPEVEPPAPQPQPQPEIERPAPQPQPQPKIERPAPQPQPQPKIERPAPQPQPQPEVERPAPQPQPQPEVERPAPQPQPQPKVEPPVPQPQPQPEVERPAPQPQPQPKIERPAPQPQPQPEVEPPAPQPQPQAAPKVEPPAPRTRRQPQAKGASQSRGNSARPNQDTPKEKPKEKPEDTPKNRPKAKDK